MEEDKLNDISVQQTNQNEVPATNKVEDIKETIKETVSTELVAESRATKTKPSENIKLKAKPTPTPKPKPKPPTKSKPKPKPPTKSTTKKPTTIKNKTKTSEKSKPRAKGILYGLSSLRRDGDVAVNIMSDHTTVKSNFVVGPLILKVEKEVSSIVFIILL